MKQQLLAGKTGVVFGVANKRSIVWAIAKAWAAAGACLIFNYQGERFKENVEELVGELGETTPLFPYDVTSGDEIKAFFEKVRSQTDRACGENSTRVSEEVEIGSMDARGETRSLSDYPGGHELPHLRQKCSVWQKLPQTFSERGFDQHHLMFAEL